MPARARKKEEEGGSIYISYQRATYTVTQRLAGALRERLEGWQVITEHSVGTSTTLGDWVRETIRRARVTLVVIGANWQLRKTDGRKGSPEPPGGWAHHEISSAFGTPGMLVIPLLVDGAAMPHVEDLPPELAALATIGSLTLRSEKLEADAERIASLIRSLPARPTERSAAAEGRIVAKTPSSTDEGAEQKASSSRPPTPASATLSPTLTGVLGELGAQKVSALELVRSVLTRHTEYFAGRATLLLEGQDPTALSLHRGATWLEQARELYPRGVLDGRRLILGLAHRSESLRTLLSQHGMFESLSREVFANAVSSGLGRLGTIGLVRGIA